MDPEHRPALDAIDRRIVAIIAGDGRISVRELAGRVSLSTSATSERLRRLERRGVVSGYRAVVSPEAIGRPLEAVIGLRARPGADRAALEAWLAAQPAVADAVHLTGPHDYLVVARCRDSAELDGLLMAMKADGMIAETETRIVLRRIPTELGLGTPPAG